ncbi:YfbR-like 5'-deoxynucleotidase [Ruegeria atlantica]|uniref:YfbR-like 5'-deoxynucleotidase n=1 Tax=Ruegeria atlantica TaxID=81569 RepID=UPI001C2C14EF|nr:YfbR-like 5'-deoxynucleotidase [Ruegeria atlantica]
MNMIQQQVVAVRVAKGPEIMLASGKWFDFLNPHGSEFDIEDIAHGLSKVCRYSGQCKEFYSVAEHSLIVSEQVEDFAFEALLHDASEAFMGDITRPLKQLVPEFKRLEAEIESAISERFDLRSNYRSVVKQADLRVLAAEQIQIMAEGCADWVEEAGIEPAPIEVRHLTPEKAKDEFLARFYELRSSR